MEVEVTSTSATVSSRLPLPDAGAWNRDLQTLTFQEESADEVLGRSNIGGLHPRPGFLKSSGSAVAALTNWFTGAVNELVAVTAGSGSCNDTSFPLRRATIY